MIFTMLMRSPEVVNFKTDIYLSNTPGEVGIRCHIEEASRPKEGDARVEKRAVISVTVVGEDEKFYFPCAKHKE